MQPKNTRLWIVGNSLLANLLFERIQPSVGNKKPLPLLPWERLSAAMDALQEAALEQSWGEGFLSNKAGRLFVEKRSCQPFWFLRGLGVIPQPPTLFFTGLPSCQEKRPWPKVHSKWCWSRVLCLKTQTQWKGEVYLSPLAQLNPYPVMTGGLGTPLSKEARDSHEESHSRDLAGAGVWMENVSSHRSPLSDFGNLYGPTPTPHIPKKPDDDYRLLPHFVFYSVSQKTHFQPTPSCFWLRCTPGGHIPRSSLRNTFSFTRPRTVRTTLMAQWLKACIPTSGRPGSVTSVRIPHLGLSFLICKMDSNTICLIGLLGILYDSVHE